MTTRSNISSTVAHLSSTTSLTRPALLALFAAGLVLSPTPSFALDSGALPTGEAVVGGSASFDRSTPNVLNVNQSTSRTVINWDSFNIGANAKTEFFQPSSSSLAVNRVVSKGSDPTQILGTLKANGRIMVLDRNGVLFGHGSVIDVGGIIASTGDISTEAVMRGDQRLVLSNLGTTGSIINEGLVNIADGGLAAFVAPTVRNSGIINAKLGKVVLAAGTETATLDLYGDGLVELAVSKDGEKVLADNSGVINAEGGTVLMTASAAKDVVDTVVNMSGIVNASSATMSGGKIILSATGGKVKVSGKADVSGKDAGSVTIDGKDVELTDSSEIAANGVDGGNGGNVSVYGDKSVVFLGSISAEGSETGGNGGTVEVSTGGDLTFAGRVSTLAPNGEAGTLVIDPTNLTIHSGLLISQNYLSNDVLTALLIGNGTVTIEASNTVNVGTTSGGPLVGTGDIDVSKYWFFGWRTTAGNLNLKAQTVNFVKNLTVGNGDVSVDATTLNLNSKVYGKDHGNTVLLGDDRLNSSNDLATINIQSPNALIQQGISFANDGVNINVGAGTYNESVKVNKSVGLYGTFAKIVPNSPGFYVTANNVTVDGFEIVGGDDGIRVSNANNVTLSDNYIHDTLSGSGISAKNSNNLVVLRNTISNTAQSGISVAGGSRAQIKNNTIIGFSTYGFSGFGIDVSRNNFVDVKDNFLFNGRGTGVRVSESNRAEINNNIISGVRGDGIQLIDSDFADITGNAIYDVRGNGIYVDPSDYVEIAWNTITGAGRDGIHIEDGRGAWIHNNTITNARRDGIDVNNNDGVKIFWNTVRSAGDNGIEVSNSRGADISGNWVFYSRGSGISLDDSSWSTISFNTVRGSRENGIETDGGSYVAITGNSVSDSGRHGISAHNTNYIFVGYNRVDDSGNHRYGHGINISFDSEGDRREKGVKSVMMDSGHDFGHGNTIVASVIGNTVTDSANDGIHVKVTAPDDDWYMPSALINVNRNDVSYSGDDGIDVSYIRDGYGPQIKMMKVNYYDAPRALINIIGNTVYNSVDDGINVTLRDDGFYGYEGPVFARAMMVEDEYEGGDYEDSYTPPTYNVFISNNNVSNDSYDDVYGEDGPAPRILSIEKEGKGRYVSYGNGDGIEVNAFLNPWSSVVTHTTIANNDVSNSGENGVYVSGPSHGTVALYGNLLTDNPVGAHFESGEIDLTGDTNTIVGGDVGLLFSPFVVGYDYDYPEDVAYREDVFAPKVAKPSLTPIYAPMSLVDNTIGTTVFEGQGTYYVELENGAFFDPGRPTLLNGLDATYDGFNPASVGGVLTQAQYNALEAMIYHYRDDSTLGLFFFGYVPDPADPVRQEDIFRLFGGYNPNSPSGGLVITGLPSLGGGRTPPAGNGGGNPFANIAPAAGDEEDTADNNGTSPQSIEPSAGGDASDAACWGDAANMLGQGSSVSYSFGDEGAKLLDKASACGNRQSL